MRAVSSSLVAVAGPGQLRSRRPGRADGQRLELGAAIAVMLDRGVVDVEDALVVQRADDHGNGIAVEQQPERRLALLQLGDVDAQADNAAVLGQPLLDQDDAAVAEVLLVPFAGLIELRRAARRSTLPRGRSLPDSRRARRRCGSYPAAARPVRTDPRCGCRCRNIACSRECSARRRRETRCPAAGCRSPRAAVRAISAHPQSQLPPRRACARSRRSPLKCAGSILGVSELGLAGRPGMRVIAACFSFFAGLGRKPGIHNAPLALCVTCSAISI